MRSTLTKETCVWSVVNLNSPLKNAFTDEMSIWYVLHLRSDFDVHMQTDEFIFGFQQAAFFYGVTQFSEASS